MTPPVRVNIGSGNEPMKDWINVDRRTVPGVDVVADVTMLPFRDGAVGRPHLDVDDASILGHALVVGREHAGLRERHRQVRREHQVHAARDGEGALAVAQALARQMHGEQR